MTLPPALRHAAVAAAGGRASSCSSFAGRQHLRLLLQHPVVAARLQRIRRRSRRGLRHAAAASPEIDGASESREGGSDRSRDAAERTELPAAAAAAADATDDDDAASSVTTEESSSASSGRPGWLSAKQVRMLLTTICEETDIAELRVGIGDYELNVRRRVSPSLANSGGGYQPNGSAVAAAAGTPPPPPAEPMAAVGTASLVEESIDEEATFNESLIYIESPKVGLMRRGLYNKNGKKIGAGPDAGDLVKKGQTLCYIEQLGTFSPVIAPQHGEVAEFLVKDGAPVEYLEPVVDLAPYFGGHIIGDMKYA